MNKEESKKGQKKSGYHVYPMSVKKQAVEEYEKGLSSSQALCQRLGISIPALHGWRRQVRKYDDNVNLKIRPQSPEELKLRVVRGIITRAFTVEQASIQYNVTKGSIKKWIEKYSSQLADINEELVPKKQDKSPADQNRIRQLERALEDANLKIIGLETMINIAEKDLKIDIRKKSGTKR